MYEATRRNWVGRNTGDIWNRGQLRAATLLVSKVQKTGLIFNQFGKNRAQILPLSHSNFCRKYRSKQGADMSGTTAESQKSTLLDGPQDGTKPDAPVIVQVACEFGISPAKQLRQSLALRGTNRLRKM